MLQKLTVYSPESDLLTPRKLLANMLADVVAARELAWRLLVRNIRAQYRQSALGYAWAFIPPVFATLIWVFLQSQNVFSVADAGMPYPLFVLSGTVLWGTFTESLNSPLNMVNGNKAMLTKINFHREALILAGMGQVLFNFCIRALLLVAVLIWFSVPVKATILLVPFGVLALIGLGITIGLLLTPLGLLYTDVSKGMGFITQGLFFLTPIIYPVPQASWAETLVKLNPVTPLLQTSRDWLTIGEASLLPGFLFVTAISALFMFIGWVIFRISMPHLISRMSA